MDHDAFAMWLERYFGAWRSNDPAEVEGLFAEQAVYSYGPFKGSVAGRDQIVRNWVGGGVRSGLDTWFEILAIVEARGVANWRVSFDGAEGARVTLDGILVCDFDATGRCTLHREWFERDEDRR